MGREIIKVSEGFQHPRDQNGLFESGAHLEPLWYTPDNEKTCFQVYENVTEGTPVSPIFKSESDMIIWLKVQGNSNEVIEQFIAMKHYPSLVVTDEYK